MAKSWILNKQKKRTPIKPKQAGLTFWEMGERAIMQNIKFEL